MEYKVVSSQSERELEQQVNELFGDGWEPYGSLVVKGDRLIQPMIRFDEEDEDDEDDE